MTICQEGTAQFTAGALVIGSLATGGTQAVGEMVVDGSGSTVLVAANFEVGVCGAIGMLTISDHAYMYSAWSGPDINIGVFVLDGVPAHGTLTMTEGGALELAGGLKIGTAGAIGVVNISSAAWIDASGIIVGADGGTGEMNICGAETFVRPLGIVARVPRSPVDSASHARRMAGSSRSRAWLRIWSRETPTAWRTCSWWIGSPVTSSA